MRAIGRVVVLLAGLSGPAAAQTNTNCYTLGNTLNCQTQPMPGTTNRGPTDYTAPFRQPAPVVGNAFGDAYQLERARQLRLQIGQMVAAGQCDAAKALALQAGDLDAAAKVATVCR